MRLADFGDLTEAEAMVRDGVETGDEVPIGDGTRPLAAAGPERQIQASFLRALILDRVVDCPVHEKGVLLRGARITGVLDLEGCRITRDVSLHHCQFDAAPKLSSAEIDNLFLDNTALPGLKADGLTARGNVHLRGAGMQVTGEVRLPGAQIGGDLTCEGGRFENASGEALMADGLEVRGGIFLRGVHVIGSVRLVGVQVGSNLECDGGQFENAGGKALNTDGARVRGIFFWRQGSAAEGAIDLTASEIGHINDDPACWPGKGDLLLDRCRYGAFTGNGVSGAERIRWLDLQDPARWGRDFWPQPWEQCAKVLREMGHPEDARQVLIEKEKRQRAANLVRLRREVGGSWQHVRIPLRIARDWLLAVLIAYGHRPLRALWWLAGMWLFGAVLFAWAHGNGGFKPNNAFILRSPEWAGCYQDDDRSAEYKDYRWRDDYPSTLACYLAQPEADRYPKFNAPLYSLDTLVPVVDLEVQDYWVPDEKVAGWARIYLWVHISMGWFLALLAVAGFSGLIDTRATRG